MTGRRYILLYPISVVYGLITGMRNFLYNTGVLKGREFRLPVICVGNITVGGTGKTPHCEYLLELLKDQFRVALLSRGYRRSTKGFILAGPSNDSRDIGDEPAEIYKRFPDVTVAVDGNRVRGIECLLREKPDVEVIILDDGFQHRRVIPGLSIILTEYSRLMIHDHMMPFGELRESVSNMYRADVILVTKCPHGLSPIQRRIVVKDMKKAPYQNLYFTTFSYGEPAPVFKTGNQQDEENEIAGQNDAPGVLILTGIANPVPFNKYIEARYGTTRKLNFPDHHRFTADDLDRVSKELQKLPEGKKVIFTTAKDAVRLTGISEKIPAQLKPLFYFIPVTVDFLNDDREEFNRLITDYVRKNKRNNRIS